MTDRDTGQNEQDYRDKKNEAHKMDKKDIIV